MSLAGWLLFPKDKLRNFWEKGYPYDNHNFTRENVFWD